jgi:hypothetical protein
MRTAALILLYIAAGVLGTYLMFRPTFDSGFARVQTERGDGMLNHYILENSWLALSDSTYRGSFLSPPMYYPAKWTIYFSENLFGVAPLYWALRVVLPPDLAYPWWQILLNALNFVAFAVVARWWKWPHVIALGGAFMWAFAMVHADQVKHQQMICRCWMPFALYYAVSLVTEPSTKALNRLLGCIFLQSLACIYTGWFLVAGLCVFVPVLVALRSGSAGGLKQFARANKRAAIRITVLWMLALLALFGPYLIVNWGIGRSYSDSDSLMPTPSAWITGPPDSMWIITTSPYRVPVYLECWLFSGFTIYALMLASVVVPFVVRAFDKSAERPAWWPLVTAAMCTVLVWGLITLAPHEQGGSLWQVVRFVPGGMAIRCVARVYLVVYLFGMLAALTWFTHVTDRIGRVWVRHAVRIVVIGAMIFEQTQYQQPNFERKNFYPLVDAAADKLRGAEVGYVVPNYTDPTGWRGNIVDDEVFCMWVGLRANVPVLNGYSGRAPKDFTPWGGLTPEQIRAALAGKYRGTVRVVDPNAPPGKDVTEVVVE